MTIPFIAMFMSAAIWFTLSTIKEPKLSLTPWLIDVCRIVFAASVLVMLYSVVGKSVF